MNSELLVRKGYLFNYAFIVALVLLAVNDHILKAQFSNVLTGKLSDIAGLVVLPLFLAFIFPKLKTNAVWVSALFFAFWKSGLSEYVIDFCNAILPIKIGRVTDYSDLLACAILPLPYCIISQIPELGFLIIKRVRFSPAWLVVPCAFLLVATSVPNSHFVRWYRPATGNIVLKDAHITVKLTKEEVLQKMANAGIIYIQDTVNAIEVATDSTHYYSNYKNRIEAGDSVISYNDWKEMFSGRLEARGVNKPGNYYRIKTLVIDGDTLHDLQFYLHRVNDKKTKIYLNSVNIEKGLTNNKAKKKMAGYYKKLAKKYLKTLY